MFWKRAALCLLLSLGHLSAHEGWTPELSLQTSAIRRVVPSPDGNWALVERCQALFEGRENRFAPELFLAPADGSSEPQLLRREAFRAAWSPDGRWISFLSTEGGVAQLYLLSLEQGSLSQLTWGNEPVLTYLWSPESERLAFTRQEEQQPREAGDDAIVADDDTFPRTALWLVKVTGGEAQRLTDSRYHVRGAGDFSEETPEFDWSPDGAEITFARSPRPEVDITRRVSSLATLDLASGAIRDWEPLYPHESLPRYSPDGRWIAFLYSDAPHTWAITGHVALRSRDEEEVRHLALTHNEGPFYRLSPMIGWWGDLLLFCEPCGTRFGLVGLPSDGGKPLAIDDGTSFFNSVTLCGDKLGLVIQNPEQLPEAYSTDVESFEPIQLTHFNDWAKEYPIPPTKKIRWSSVDGEEIEGLLTLPSGYQEGEQLPLLLIVHGGPAGFHSERCIATPAIYPIAQFAEAGFAVLQPNPRGSCGYGKRFRYLNYQDWGGFDYHDVMRGVDLLIRDGVADPDRLGVMGWSYGGYMTLWTITQTSRFRAASVLAAPSNLISLAGTIDIPSYLVEYFGGDWWNRRSLYQERSPLTHVQRVTTPCLLQHGATDGRVPLSQSEEFYRALRRLGVEAQFVTYPRAGHELKEPRQLLDSMHRNLNWFNSHLSGG